MTLTAIQATTPTAADIAGEVTKVVMTLARKEQRARGVRNNAAVSSGLRTLITGVTWTQTAEAIARSQSKGERAGAVAATTVRKHMRVPWLVSGPLDKGRHRVRFVCPAMAWRELEEAADPYCTWGPWIATPQATVWTEEWRRKAEETNNRWKHCGWPEMPTSMTPAEARTAAKSKAPVDKFRLIVATNKTPTAVHAKLGAGATEFMVDLANSEWAGERRGVESVSQVIQKLEALTATIREAQPEGRK